MEPLKREDGWLLQTYGEGGEMRAHWETDEGGGRWVEFVAWWSFEGGRWEPRRGEKASGRALLKLVELLIVRGVPGMRPPPQPTAAPGTGKGSDRG